MSRFALTLCACLLALCSAVRAADKEAGMDDEGFIRHWLILAPIPYPSESNGYEEIDKPQIKDEAGVKPKEGDKVKVGDKELTWKLVKISDYFFDINEILGSPNEYAVAYAVAYVEAPEEMKDIMVSMGSNDQGKVYVNGKEAVKFDATRTVDKDQDSGKTTLKKGVNTIVFKVINENNNWQGCLRFTKPDGTPIKNLKVKTTP